MGPLGLYLTLAPSCIPSLCFLSAMRWRCNSTTCSRHHDDLPKYMGPGIHGLNPLKLRKKINFSSLKLFSQVFWLQQCKSNQYTDVVCNLYLQHSEVNTRPHPLSCKSKMKVGWPWCIYVLCVIISAHVQGVLVGGIFKVFFAFYLASVVLLSRKVELVWPLAYSIISLLFLISFSPFWIFSWCALLYTRITYYFIVCFPHTLLKRPAFRETHLLP
jgi:hypothetical protein